MHFSTAGMTKSRICVCTGDTKPTAQTTNNVSGGLGLQTAIFSHQLTAVFSNVDVSM